MRFFLTLLVGCAFEHGTIASRSRDAGGDGMSADAEMIADARPAPVDAAPGFDPTTCPTNYVIMVPSSASRYRVRSPDVWWNHEQNCGGDTSGKSHLVVFDSASEAAQLRLMVSGSFFVGAVQARNQTLATSGWSWLTGETIAAEAWELAQPDDGDGIENNRENLAIESGGAGGGLRDFDTVSSSSLQAQGVCECDGKPVSSSVSSQIPSDPT